MTKRAPLVKWLLLVVIATGTVALDLGTKIWAEDALANREHPLVVELPAEDVGRLVSEVFTERLGDSVDPAWAVPAPAAIQVDADARILDSRILDQHVAFLYRSDDGRTARLVRNELLERLRKAKESDDRGAVRDDAEAALQDVTVATYLTERVPRQGREDVREALEAGRVFSYPALSEAAAEGRRVETAGAWLVFDRRIEVVPGALDLIYAENPGAAWGFMRDLGPGIRRTFLGGVSLLAMFFILYMYRTVPRADRISQVAFASLLGGAMGNFWERLIQGYVVDFIDMYVGDSHWPTYNVADIAISVGVGLLLLQMIRKKSPFEALQKPARG
ncbi:MAG: signal peptidase II [Pseudomonadota bacterium]